MKQHHFGVHARAQNGASFDEVLHWKRSASRWHQQPPRTSSDEAGRYELFDDALLRIPPFIERWRRALDAPQALSSLAQLWLALDLIPENNSAPALKSAMRLPPKIDALVLDEARRLRAQYPLRPSYENSAPEAAEAPLTLPEETDTPKHTAGIWELWERFYDLPTRLQAERVRQRVKPALHWELHALEARQTRRLPPLTLAQQTALDRYNEQPCPLDSCFQAVLAHFECQRPPADDHTLMHTTTTELPHGGDDFAYSTPPKDDPNQAPPVTCEAT